MTTDGGAQAGARLVLDEADYGAAIRAARQQRGLSQRRLAQRCGINVTYLCDIELGRRKPPSVEVRAAIQAETGVCCPTREQLAAQVAALTEREHLWRTAIAQIAQSAHGAHGGLGSFRWCGERCCHMAYALEQDMDVLATTPGLANTDRSEQHGR